MNVADTDPAWPRDPLPRAAWPRDPLPRVAWPRDALPRGTEINSYRIDAVIGRGGFGITYRVLDGIDQVFAVKECFPKQFAVRQGCDVFASDSAAAEPFQDCLERFGQEARALRQLSAAGTAGDGVVRVATYFTAHGTAYTVMEFLAGQTLAQLIAAHPSGVPAALLDMMLPRLLHALGCVHDSGLLHRDIKPENIMLRGNGNPVLIDFGAARAISAGRTVTFTQVFSEGFAPVEQFLGVRQGPYSDIYALGATLYRCIGGTAPDAFTRQQAVARGEADPLAPAVTIGQGRYRISLLAAIDAALSVAPELRPQSVGALQQLMGDSGDDDPATKVDRSEAPRPDGRQAASTAGRRVRVHAMLLAALAVGGLAGAVAWRVRPPVLLPAPAPHEVAAPIQARAEQMRGMLGELGRLQADLHASAARAASAADDLAAQSRQALSHAAFLQQRRAALGAAEQAALARQTDERFSAALEAQGGTNGMNGAIAAAIVLAGANRTEAAQTALAALAAQGAALRAIPHNLSAAWQQSRASLLRQLNGKWGLGGCANSEAVSTWLYRDNDLQVFWPRDPLHEYRILAAWDGRVYAVATAPRSEAGAVWRYEPRGAAQTVTEEGAGRSSLLVRCHT